MLDETILDFQISILIIIGTVVFIITSRKRRELLIFLPAYIGLSIGTVFIFLQIIDYGFRIIGNIIFLIATLLFIAGVYYEYYQVFINKGKQTRFKDQIKYTILLLSFTLTPLIGIQIFMMILLSLASCMVLRIFFEMRRPTDANIFIFLIFTVLSLFSTILANFRVEGAWEFSYLTNIVYATFFMVMPIVAYLENRLIKSEAKYRESYNRAEFYKDLFAHDISNMLQNFQISLELIPKILDDPDKLEEIFELINLAKEEINRGANLGSNVRILSELDEKKIQINPVEVYEVLKRALNYIKIIFNNKNIEVNIDFGIKKVWVKGNELLFDLFKNILINAIKHNDNQVREILIRVTREIKEKINYIKLEFIDNGRGIPDLMKDIIFQRSYNKPKDLNRTGLGLSLIIEIIKSYNGEIWVEDRIKGDYSQGSNFNILIPEADYSL